MKKTLLTTITGAAVLASLSLFGGSGHNYPI
jgi:hypothetical protein